MASTNILTIVTLNSTYEIDTVGKRIRRKVGRNSPTTSFNADNEWSTWNTLTLNNGSLLIEWAPNTKHASHTQTSPVYPTDVERLKTANILQTV